MKWITRDGKRIPLWLMTNNHIQNTLNLLYKAKREYLTLIDYLYSLHYDFFEYESMKIERDICFCRDMLIWIDRWIKRFRNEQERRKKSYGSNKRNNEAV